jgi:cytochrome c-type biogenesis protein CcmF
MTAWLMLTVGLALGGLWAYEELGWGGYWGWDPVENAALLPWFTATAFLHSVMVQERRGMLKIWNVSLVIVTFFLTIFGTFMTRSGIVQSVHAFGEDPELARMFTVFMVLLLTVSFGLVIHRMPMLRARNELDSWASREAAFLANNWVLLFAAFFVLFATMFPTLSEAIRGERLTVKTSFFEKWMTPVGLILLFLTGVGPLLAWRKSTIVNLQRQFMWPATAAIVVAAFVTWLGIPFWASGLCFALCAMVTATVGQEFVQGALVRRRATGTDLFTALVGLFARSRRRYAGYIVHLGIVLIFFGFAGGGFDRKETVLVTPGRTADIAPYRVTFERLSVVDDVQKQMITAHLQVTRGDASLGGMYPARWFYRNREEEPTTEVALRRGVAEDLYVVLAGYNIEDQSATLEISINPLVNWIWLGIGVMLIGTAIALLPERALAFATSRVPEGAVTTSMILLIVLGGASHAHAQHVESSQPVVIVARTPLEKEMHQGLVCMCPTCGRKRIGECTCPVATQMRTDLARLVGEGKTREEIVAYFVARHGSQEVLDAPIDRGFNRLAWLVPYAAGAASVALVGLLAIRWSRRRGSDEAVEPALTPRSRDLEDKLDDELRDLD